MKSELRGHPHCLYGTDLLKDQQATSQARGEGGGCWGNFPRPQIFCCQRGPEGAPLAFFYFVVSIFSFFLRILQEDLLLKKTVREIRGVFENFRGMGVLFLTKFIQSLKSILVIKFGNKMAPYIQPNVSQFYYLIDGIKNFLGLFKPFVNAKGP